MSPIFLAGQGLTQSETTVDYPRADRLVSSNPKRLTQSLYEHPNMNCGIWQCEVGAWNIVFAYYYQETAPTKIYTLPIHDAQTQSFIEVKAGEAGIIPPSFKGTFEVVEAVKKYFVVVEA